jgi:hypothetical protein
VSLLRLPVPALFSLQVIDNLPDDDEKNTPALNVL